MIKINNLKIMYPDGNVAIENFSMNIQEGETVALLGANGAGKSTLLRSIVGITPASEGEIHINSLKLGKNTLSEVRQRVGMVFQNPDDQLFMTHVYEDIGFGPRNYGWPENEVKARVEGTMSQLEISHLARRLPSKLSGGEKRMVAIAGVLAMDPVLMLFDEPTSFLDPKSKRNLIKVLKKINVTKLIATHDMDIVKEICDRVVIIVDGKIGADGKPDFILSNQRLLEECGL